MPEKTQWKDLKKKIINNYKNIYDLERSMNLYAKSLEEEVKKIEAAGLSMDDCIQVGSKSMGEMLQEGIEDYKNMSREDKALFITYFTAGSSFIKKEERPLICSLIPERDSVQAKPLVTGELPERMSEDELGLWDKFCNLFGIKTEMYRRYDESQAEYERVRQLREQEQRKTEEMKLQIRENLIENKRDRFLQANETKFNEAAEIKDLVQTQEEKWNKLFFGDEKLDDWEFEDGKKLTALEVCMGILHGELGYPGNYLTATPEEAQEMDIGEDKIREAVVIYRGLLERRENEKQEFIDSGKTGSYKISNSLNTIVKEAVEAHFNTTVTPLDEEHLKALQSGDREKIEKVTAQLYPIISAKAKLYEVTGSKLYEPSLEEEMVISTKLRIDLENKMHDAAKEGRYSDFQDLNKKALTVSVYEDSLSKLAAEQSKHPEHEGVSVVKDIQKLRSGAVQMVKVHMMSLLTVEESMNAAHLVMQNKLTEGFYLATKTNPDLSVSITGSNNKFNLFDEVEIEGEKTKSEPSVIKKEPEHVGAGELSMIVKEPELEEMEL